MSAVGSTPPAVREARREALGGPLAIAPDAVILPMCVRMNLSTQDESRQNEGRRITHGKAGPTSKAKAFGAHI